MARVKVRNLNKHPYREKYQDKEVYFGVNGSPDDSVEMDEEDAVVFLGGFCAPKLDNKGNHDPAGFKMLRIERLGSQEAAKDSGLSKFMCPVCREQTSSWTELEAHTRLMHSEQLLRDDEFEKSQKEKNAKAPVAASGGAR